MGLPGRDERRAALARSAERLATASVSAATLLTVLLMGRSQVGPYQRPWTFGLVFWLWAMAGLLLVSMALLPLIRLADRALGRPWALHVTLSAAAGYVLVATLALNRRAFVNLWAMDASRRFLWLSVAAATFGGLGLAASAFPFAWRRTPRLLTLLAATSFVAAFWPATPPPPPQSEVASLPPSASRERVLVVGVDGAGWNLMEPLIARGDLPNFEALRARGSWGPLATLKPTLSPALWTTMATGHRPERHGIEDFSLPRLRGVDDPMPSLLPVRGLPIHRLPVVLRKIGQVVDSPAASTARRVAALWNIATSQGSPMNVVTWYVTWPAEPVLGTMVSDRIFYFPPGRSRDPGPVVFPPSLYSLVAPKIVSPSDIRFSDLLRLIHFSPAEFAALANGPDRERDAPSVIRAELAHFETTLDTTLLLMDRDRQLYGEPRDTLVYFRLVDRVEHRALQEWELGALTPATPARARLYGQSVTGAYRLADEALGKLLRVFGEGNVLVVSDHSFELVDRWGDLRYDHFDAPDGIWIAAGPAIVAGRHPRLSIYEIFPLLARLKGFPLSRAIRARPPEQILSARFQDANPPRWVERYGAREAIPAQLASHDVDREIIEELRAVGYVQ